MDNPFRYGEVVTGAAFWDRSRELAELEGDIRSGQNVVVVSPRRYGKTSLVLRAIEDLKQERVLVAYLDLFRTPTKDRFADHLASAIYGGLVAPVERAWQRALDSFQRLAVRPKISLGQDGTPTFEFTAVERPQDIDRAIEALLMLPGQVAAERKRRVALILDEFQEVVSIDQHLPGLMRAVFQLQPEVAHVFLGSKQHLMQRVFNDRNEPLYRMAKPLVLGRIGQDDMAGFIRERFASGGRRVSDEAIQRILQVTEGHPHDTQELCYFTWSIAQGERRTVSPQLVRRALERVIEAENARYTILWEALSAHQRVLLAALVQDGEAVYSEAYRSRHRLGPASSVQKSLERLVERELVELVPPRSHRITDVFLRAWIEAVLGGRKATGYQPS